MKKLMKFFKAIGNILMLPVILLFKYRNLLIFSVMILNLWFTLGTWLFWMIAANLVIHAYSIYTMRMRNKNYRYAAVQTHMLNGKLSSLEELKLRELEKLHELEKDA